MLLIIDADPLVYRSGFAAESISYRIVAEIHGQLAEQYFDPSQGKSANDKLKEWLAANPDADVLDKEKTVKAEPVSHALEIVRSSLASISAEAAEKFKASVGTLLLLTGKENWRNKVATLLPYKGNRDPSHKPVHYQAIRDYLVSAHGAVVTEGKEADDAVATHAAYLRHEVDDKGYCIASIDKDLDQIPGWHYDYMKKVFYFIDAEDAARSFWQQVLSGDSTDNIGGVWKLGAKGAKKLVDEWYMSGTSPQGIWDQIVMTYKASQAKPSCPYVDKDPCAVALENARLLYLQQKPDELWQPPPMPRGKVSVEFAG